MLFTLHTDFLQSLLTQSCPRLCFSMKHRQAIPTQPSLHFWSTEPVHIGNGSLVCLYTWVVCYTAVPNRNVPHSQRTLECLHKPSRPSRSFHVHGWLQCSYQWSLLYSSFIVPGPPHPLGCPHLSHLSFLLWVIKRQGLDDFNSHLEGLG